jgi:hypothetical protein
MIIVIILFSFIIYLIYIYINLSRNKSFEIISYMNKANKEIENIKTKKLYLKNELKNKNEEINLIKNNLNNIQNKSNICISNLENLKKINKINEILLKDSDDTIESDYFKDYYGAYKKIETNLYRDLGECKSENIKYKIKNEDLIKDVTSRKKELEMVYKYLKIADYAMYEESLKKINYI